MSGARSEITEIIFANTGISLAKAQHLTNQIIDKLADHLVTQGRLTINQFGTFRVGYTYEEVWKLHINNTELKLPPLTLNQDSKTVRTAVFVPAFNLQLRLDTKHKNETKSKPEPKPNRPAGPKPRKPTPIPYTTRTRKDPQ
jgi:hypothetical protein